MVSILYLPKGIVIDFFRHRLNILHDIGSIVMCQDILLVQLEQSQANSEQHSAAFIEKPIHCAKGGLCTRENGVRRRTEG